MSVSVCSLLQLYIKLPTLSRGFTAPETRQSLLLPSQIADQSLVQRLLIPIFPCHSISQVLQSWTSEGKEKAGPVEYGNSAHNEHALHNTPPAESSETSTALESVQSFTASQRTTQYVQVLWLRRGAIIRAQLHQYFSQLIFSDIRKACCQNKVCIIVQSHLQEQIHFIDTSAAKLELKALVCQRCPNHTKRTPFLCSQHK